MTQKQYKWREALLNPSAKPKTKTERDGPLNYLGSIAGNSAIRGIGVGGVEVIK